MLNTTPLRLPSIQRLPAASVQYIAPCRRENGVGGTKRQMLGLRDKGRGGIVDEYIDRRLGKNAVHHGIDLCAIPDVATVDRDLAGGGTAHLGRRLLEQFKPAAADQEIGA